MTQALAFKVVEGPNSRDATIDGVLNANSYSAVAVVDLTAFAVEVLHNGGIVVNAVTVKGLTQTFARVIQDVQFGLSGSNDWQDGLNARMRTALRTSVETYPAPWGADADAFAEWVRSITARTKAIVNVAIAIFSLGTNLDDAPWNALAGLAPVAA